jgi:hypothetical protein
LRDGSLRTLDLMHLAGVVTFPSFHAAAVLYAWAVWPMRLLRLPNLLCKSDAGGDADRWRPLSRRRHRGSSDRRRLDLDRGLYGFEACKS